MLTLASNNMQCAVQQGQPEDQLLELCYLSNVEFQKEYKKLKPIQIKDFYYRILNQIKKAIISKNFEHFKAYSRLVAQLNKIENRQSLQLFFNDDNCPLNGTNLIILACKYDTIDILEFLLTNTNKILNSLSTDIGNCLISPNDEDTESKNPFYYSIRSNNVQMLEILWKNWPDDIESDIIDMALSKSYNKLILQNVYISEEVRFSIEMKLIKVRFTAYTFGGIQRPPTSIEEIRKRSYLVIDNMQKLAIEYKETKEIDETFLYIAKFLITNIYVLKKLLRITYDRLPWEEMHFCLVIFVKSFRNSNEISFYYRSIINKTKLLCYLNSFSIEYEDVLDNLQGSDLQNYNFDNLPEREYIIDKLSLKNSAFKELYEDYSKVRDVYSLKRIKYYIELAINSNEFEDSDHEILLIERALQVLSENIKSTLASPNLSYDLSNLMFLTFPENIRKVIKDLRNSMSYKYALRRRIGTNSCAQYNYAHFQNIKNDLRKIHEFVLDIYYRYKYEKLEQIVYDLYNCKSSDDFKRISDIFNGGYIEMGIDTLMDNPKNINEYDRLKQYVQELHTEIQTCNEFQKALFDKIDNELKLNYDDLSDSRGTYHDYFFLITTLIRSKNENNCSQENIAAMVKSFIYPSTKAVMKPKLVKVRSMNNIINLAMQILNIARVSTQKINFETIEYILRKIIFTIDINAKRVKSIKELHEKFKINRPYNMNSLKRKILLNDIVYDKIDKLRSILIQNQIDDNIKSIQQFLSLSFNQNRPSLAIIEMLLFDILSIYEDSLSDNLFFLDNYFPILLGKELRLQIATNSTIYDVLPFNRNLSIVVNAIEFVIKNNSKMNRINYMLIDSIKSDFQLNTNMLAYKQQLFDSIVNSNNNVKTLKSHSNVDLQSRDMNGFNILHIAVKNSHIDVFKHYIKYFQNKLEYLADLRNLYKQNVFHIAANYANCCAIEYILWNYKEIAQQLNNKDYTGRTPLHYAVSSGCMKTIKLILNATSDAVHYCDLFMNRPIHKALQFNHIEVFEMMLYYEKSSGNSSKENGGYSFLQMASEYGHTDIVELLLKRNVDVTQSTEKGWTALHAASLYGHVEIVKLLLSGGASANSRLSNHCTPLHFAIEGGHTEVVKVLIKNSADVNAIEHVGHYSPLHYAAEIGCFDILEILLKKAANPCVTTIRGLTPLHFAARYGYVEILEILLKCNVNVNAVDTENRTPLFYATEANNATVFELLLKANANVNIIDKDNMTPLHKIILSGNFDIINLIINEANSFDCSDHLQVAVQSCNLKIVDLFFQNCTDLDEDFKNTTNLMHTAISKGSKEICEYLINEGINVNSRDSFQMTPIHLATIYGHCDIVRLLLQNGANVNDKMCGFTPLHVNILLGLTTSIDIIDVLTKSGANINVDINGLTPLSAAIRINRLDVVDVLIKRGVNINSCDVRPIIQAMICGYNSVVEIFLRYSKFDMKIETADNSTLLHLAAKYCNSGVMKMLTLKGCDVNAKTVENVTPLHLAAEADQGAVAEILIQNGANVNAQLIDGTTPLHMAAEKDNTGIVELLFNYSADVNSIHMDGTPLHFAIRYGSINSITLLLEHRLVNVNAYSKDNWTPLHVAAQMGHLDITILLINKGADVHARNIFHSKPIHIAAREGNIHIMKYYLENHFNLITETGSNNQNLLHYASQNRKIDVIQYLIKNKIDINAKDDNGQTPLHVAARHSCQEICELLLKHGAIYNSINIYSCTPFHLSNVENEHFFSLINQLFVAVYSNDVMKVKELILTNKNKIYLDSQSTDGITILHFAVSSCYEEIVTILLKSKANVNIADSNFNMPLHSSVKRGHLTITQDLLKYGAIYNTKNSNNKTPLDLATNSEIKNLLKLVDKLFNYVKQNDTKILNELTNMKDIENYKKIFLGVKNIYYQTLFTYAITCNFTKIEQLKEIFLGNKKKQLLQCEALAANEQYQEAYSIYNDITMEYEQVLGSDNPLTLEAQTKVATMLYKMEKYQDALKINENIYKKQNFLFGIYNETVLKTRSFTALILHRLDRNEEALSIFSDICDKQVYLHGSRHEDVLETKNNIGVVLDHLQRYEAALKVYNESYEIRKGLNGPDHPLTLSAACNIARIMNNQKKHKEALELYQFVFKKRCEVLGVNHSETVRTLLNIIGILINQKKFDKALQKYNDLYCIQEKMLGPLHRDTLITRENIANVLFQQGSYMEALGILKEIYPKLKELLGNSHQSIKSMEYQMVICSTSTANISYENGPIVDGVKTLPRKQISKNILANDNSELLCLMNDFFKSIQSSNLCQMKELLKINSSLVNSTNRDGLTPLHFAVNMSSKYIVSFLLRNYANPFLLNPYGNTPLHTATSANNIEICTILIEYVRKSNESELTDFINAQTTVTGKSALHIAGKFGFYDICTLLMQNGAIYNCVDKDENKRPVDYSTNPDVKKLFQSIDELFEDAQIGSFCMLEKLNGITLNELSIYTNVRNSQNQTITQVAVLAGHKNLAATLIKMIQDSK